MLIFNGAIMKVSFTSFQMRKISKKKIFMKEKCRQRNMKILIGAL